jgi:hypothetical protein
MGMRRRFSYLCLAFVEDTLADLEGILEEIRFQSGESWPASGIRWVRRRRNRLRSLMRRHPTSSHAGARRSSGGITPRLEAPSPLR